MTIVILLAVIVLICLMCRAALSSPRSGSSSAAAFAEGAAEGTATALRAILVHAPGEPTTHRPVELLDEPLDVSEPEDRRDRHDARESHDRATFAVEADDPPASHGVCHDDDTSGDSDVSCDSGDSDWSFDDD